MSRSELAAREKRAKRISRHQLSRDPARLEQPMSIFEAQAAIGRGAGFEQVDAHEPNLVFGVAAQGHVDQPLRPSAVADADFQESVAAMLADRPIDRSVALRPGKVGKQQIVEATGG